jgi:hypothetical protein
LPTPHEGNCRLRQIPTAHLVVPLEHQGDRRHDHDQPEIRLSLVLQFLGCREREQGLPAASGDLDCSMAAS